MFWAEGQHEQGTEVGRGMSCSWNDEHSAPVGGHVPGRVRGGVGTLVVAVRLLTLVVSSGLQALKPSKE